ncbi:MAG: hypothetical protein RLZZ299_2884 [Pseudomonadota bacterium]|jgi:signal transduction histidine kinase
MRRAVYLALALLLAVLALVGLREVANARVIAAEREQRVARERLQAFVEQWETAVGERGALWLAELAAGEDVELRERFLRDNVPWFDAFYAWEPGTVNWPPAHSVEDLPRLRRDPCVRRASLAATRGAPADAAARYEACATHRDPAVRLLATSEAAELYLNAEQPAAAERVIARLGPLLLTPLHRAGEAGLDARRLVALRLEHARALDALGRSEAAERRALTLALEILVLNGPELEHLLPLYAWPVAHDLRTFGGPALATDDDEAWLRAQRRLALWQEVRDRTWTPRDVPLLRDGPRLLADPYSDPPWLLSYARLDDGTLVGLQLDQPTLIASLLARAPGPLRHHLSVRDPTGRVLAGAAGPLQVELAFTHLLPQLRVGLTAGSVDDASGRRVQGAQLAPVLLGLVTGVLALLGLIATDRRQDRLLAQQREFMTRVTHELKTPLAGIRLMAENLELGAFRDAEQRARFAQQIVKEAERLGLRLDEVIRAAARPLEERPETTDLAALVRSLAERWRPHYEQQRATLALDLPEGEVLATVRPIQLRDAVSNLLDNALKYRSTEHAAKATVVLRADRRWVTLEVIDNGIGVPADRRRAIFERFIRVEGPGRGRAGGHGLGLAFVAEAARAHRGKVECRESPDGGTRFVIRIRRRI